MDSESFAVELDGRTIEALRAGPAASSAVVFHNGTPTAAMLLPTVVAAASAHGLSTISFSRPGYGGSTERHGRSVADNAAVTAAVLDSAGVDDFFSAGWSGGGPHALADVAVLGERCRSAATLAGVAPYGAPGLDWMAGMAEENVAEFALAAQGEGALAPFLEEVAGHLAAVDGAGVAESLGGLVSEVDIAALTGEFADLMATSLRNAVASGVAGWRDDDLAFLADWGFSLDSITRPVAVWQGAQDRMVPFAHGEWLAANVPGAQAHLFPDEGHLSLVARVAEVIDDLVARG